jgi:hypothetical protein
MSFLTPALLATGPVAPAEITSLGLIDPTPTSRDFQILFVVIVVNISVRVLKQSRPNKATSRKNW